MATDAHQSSLFELGQGNTQPELLVSAVLHLMSHYTANTSEAGPCVKLASIIERHFKALAALPELPPVLRATCQQLSEQWSMIVERSIQEPTKRGIFSRLVGSAQH